jgi:hypothetical protein
MKKDVIDRDCVHAKGRLTIGKLMIEIRQTGAAGKMPV